ncbi:hypothetical protein LTY59_07065 [Limosilactobacillus balticus]|uniref:Uncharacterized protein n=1 Tax=Limosilactobacillus balticus TaxID=2759747 RepID=A0ABS8REG2_9LACO|nr:hypothetical protein [Limosilactobacillus balticus]MBB1109482.1 hypothetical protein [Limosilactobacillus balticus]MCD7138979.1 hypothetical protein [Limosilactobacillus balticus]
MVLLEIIRHGNVTYNFGNIADWISALAAIFAFGVVIWQQFRQEKITRALKIEQARPRFMRSIKGKLPDETDVLKNNQMSNRMLYEIIQKSRNDINKTKSELLTLENISENTIYCLEMLVIYEDKSKQFWKKIGMRKNGIITLVPSFLDGGIEPSKEIKDRVKLIARFLTPLNETGFYIYNYKSKEESYLFVKDKYNKLVRPLKNGKILKKNDKYIKRLNEEFDTQKGKIFIEVPYRLLKARYSNES